MTRLLLDTHVLIWLAEKDPNLGKAALRHISKAYANETLFVSSMSFWEMGMLVAKKRIALSRPLDAWRKDVLATGIQESVITSDIALLATQFNWNHHDPADRMIVATAMLTNSALITADKIILRWKQAPKTINAKQ